MPTPQDVYYLVFALIGTTGVGGAIAQIIHYLFTRKKERPEVDKIITEGARNAVEALQIALEQSQAEVRELKREMVALEARHKAEIERFEVQLASAQRLLDGAHIQITQLTKDVAALRDDLNGGHSS